MLLLPSGSDRAVPLPSWVRLNEISDLLQVDGCGRNLAKEKEYYRRYRVCKSHAGAQEVVLGGEAKRYCQQCSVFHLLADFDGDKRCGNMVCLHGVWPPRCPAHL